jgi:hypothetical protein
MQEMQEGKIMEDQTGRLLDTLSRITDLIVLMDANIKGIIIKLNDLEARLEDLEAR